MDSVESRNKLESWIAGPPNQRSVGYDVLASCLDPTAVNVGHDVGMTVVPSLEACRWQRHQESGIQR